jgi:hypothetical protein|tara:strand:- start:215 stop:496 length:282 start_codon:yes stop_codon:yes gene_type:complete
MGGSPARVIKKTITRVVGGGGGGSPPAQPTSDISERRTEVKKATEPEGKKLVRRKVTGRKRRSVSQLANYAPSTQLGETSVRNPQNTKKTLGA